jgi:hypothetical protein
MVCAPAIPPRGFAAETPSAAPSYIKRLALVKACEEMQARLHWVMHPTFAKAAGWRGWRAATPAEPAACSQRRKNDWMYQSGEPTPVASS